MEALHHPTSQEPTLVKSRRSLVQFLFLVLTEKKRDRWRDFVGDVLWTGCTFDYVGSWLYALWPGYRSDYTGYCQNQSWILCWIRTSIGPGFYGVQGVIYLTAIIFSMFYDLILNWTWISEDPLIFANGFLYHHDFDLCEQYEVNRSRIRFEKP